MAMNWILLRRNESFGPQLKSSTMNSSGIALPLRMSKTTTCTSSTFCGMITASVESAVSSCKALSMDHIWPRMPLSSKLRPIVAKNCFVMRSYADSPAPMSYISSSFDAICLGMSTINVTKGLSYSDESRATPY